ncbi:MAG: ribonuclease HII [Chitinivibrionales bacterium]|nr:ribonuclease HII [Chitinivibrionales bacterium]
MGIVRENDSVLIGIDEAGRGPLAGPVTAAAVLLDLDSPLEEINDSKKLTARKRERLCEEIKASAKDYGIGLADPHEIDKINILQASLLAMQRAIDQLKTQWTLALVDGNRPIPSLHAARQKTIIRGDGTSASIAAASILAKVERDRIMEDNHFRYPLYEFSSNKGYPTPRHKKLISKNGICPIHRKSFCLPTLSEIVLPLE